MPFEKYANGIPARSPDVAELANQHADEAFSQTCRKSRSPQTLNRSIYIYICRYLHIHMYIVYIHIYVYPYIYRALVGGGTVPNLGIFRDCMHASWNESAFD